MNAAELESLVLIPACALTSVSKCKQNALKSKRTTDEHLCAEFTCSFLLGIYGPLVKTFGRDGRNDSLSWSR